MTINNPPVFNRIIASGGEIGTVSVASGVMEWTFDAVKSYPDALARVGGNPIFQWSTSGNWNMATSGNLIVSYPFPTADIVGGYVIVTDNAGGRSVVNMAWDSTEFTAPFGMAPVFIDVNPSMGQTTFTLRRRNIGTFDYTPWNNAAYEVVIYHT